MRDYQECCNKISPYCENQIPLMEKQFVETTDELYKAVDKYLTNEKNANYVNYGDEYYALPNYVKVNIWKNNENLYRKGLSCTISKIQSFNLITDVYISFFFSSIEEFKDIFEFMHNRLTLSDNFKID